MPDKDTPKMPVKSRWLDFNQFQNMITVVMLDCIKTHKPAWTYVSRESASEQARCYCRNWDTEATSDQWQQHPTPSKGKTDNNP
jgi:hypothetical protein